MLYLIYFPNKHAYIKHISKRQAIIKTPFSLFLAENLFHFLFLNSPNSPGVSKHLIRSLLKNHINGVS